MPYGSVMMAKRLSVFAAIGFGMMAAVSSASASLTTDSMSQLIAQKSGDQQDASEIKVPPARISTQSSIRRASSQTPVSYSASSSNASANLQSYTSYPAYQDSQNPANYSHYPNQPSYSTQSQSYPDQSQPKRLTIVQSAKNSSPEPKAVIQPNYSTKAYSVKDYPTIVAAPKTPAVLPAFLRGSGIAGNYDNVDSSYLPLLSQAESQSSRAARNVLATARAMALNERTIIKGGCWDYLNAVFNRAGVSKNTILKGAYKGGPYANPQEIQVGDWLYYINHGYNDIEHSGLFVGWVDEANKQALILSYAGESRHEPARYKVYDLSHVYHIMRPV